MMSPEDKELRNRIIDANIPSTLVHALFGRLVRAEQEVEAFRSDPSNSPFPQIQRVLMRRRKTERPGGWEDVQLSIEAYHQGTVIVRAPGE